MMTMDQTSNNSNFGDFSVYSSDPFGSASPPINVDVDVDWSVFENADRYLLRDDSAWITRLSKDFWWNLERISELIASDVNSAQQMNTSRSTVGHQKLNANGQQSMGGTTKNYPQAAPTPMQFNGAPPRKIVGQRAQIPTTNPYRGNNSMFNNGFASPPPSSSSSSSSSGSTIVRPSNNQMHAFNNTNNNNNIPDKSNFFQAFSSMSISNDQDIEYNPFQSKISFDNNMWATAGQQAILWQ